MSASALPSLRPGWNAHPERRRATEGHALMDAQRWLHSLLSRAMPRHADRLPRAVARELAATQRRVVQLDAAQFDAAIADVRGGLLRHGLVGATAGQALAVAGAAMARALGKTPYDTQYRAAWLILQGRLAEMATGEGKTIAAAIAAAAAALGQVRVHLMTANDYLVQRDSEALTPFYAALGLSVGCVVTLTPRDERLRAYRCDITFVTAKELVFDYLKDHLRSGGEHDPCVLRARALQAGAQAGDDAGSDLPLLPGLSMAILDEADAILLDEASMPLILAQPGPPVDASGYARAFEIAASLQRERDYRALSAARTMHLTDAGRDRVSLAVQGAAGVLAPPQRAHELVEAALTARWVFRRDREYAVIKGGVQLIDEVTGRIAEGRQWTGALQPMVELKEGVALSPPASTAAQITYQRFFPRYLRLGGMSGTLTEAQHELRMLYDVGVARVPLARVSQRRWLGETLFIDAAAKWAAVVERVIAMSCSGRPVLIGTDSVADSAHLSSLLQVAGIEHQVLNAVQDADEAACIARAGRHGSVTVATNMAGRGTDIQLDATAAAAGGLHVIACMRNRARRIDRQLIGRCARHGDPGSAQTLLALDDALLQRIWPAWLRRAAAACAVQDGPQRRVPALLAAPLLSVAQRITEWHETQHRKQLRRAERQLGALYGFAGQTE